jgi:hypothetical protein
MSAILAAGAVWGWSVGELAIIVVIIAAVCALVWVALRQFGVAVPAWIQQVVWIIVVAVVVVAAIRLVLSL